MSKDTTNSAQGMNRQRKSNLVTQHFVVQKSALSRSDQASTPKPGVCRFYWLGSDLSLSQLVSSEKISAKEMKALGLGAE